MTETSTDTVLDGRYRLLAQLAVGGTSTVHLAHDQTLDRTVAIKVLHPHLANDPTFLDRFRREANAVASVAHPHVVTLHDVAADGGYLVMEHVDGPSLRDVLRLRGRLRPAEVLSLLGPVAAGVAAAHDVGLVHRDVKPENVLLGSDGQVKVGDFGLARAAAGASVTFGPDQFAGSPHYTPPEAVRGESLDARSDVYALGIMLYECLTGRPPFEADTPFATAMLHTSSRVPPPSQQAKGIGAALDRVVLTATDPDPSGRYPDASAFALALATAVPEGPAPVDLRDGDHQTIVLPVVATETVVTARDQGATGRRWLRRRSRGADAAATTAGATRRPRRRLVLAILLGLLVLGGAGWGVYDQVVAPVTPLPTVVGTSPDAAVAALRDAGFDPVVSDEQRFSLDAPLGTVAATDPTDSARRGATVTLFVSAGPRQIAVPAVDGREEVTARALIEAEGFTAVVDSRYDETVPEGLAVGTEPSAGIEVDEGSEIVLVISRGRQPIEVPSVVGEPLVDARARLEALGLVVEEVGSAYDDEVPEGAVLAQSVEPATVLYRGDVVQLTVSDGPEPFAMPDVTGQTEADARSQLEGLGLQVDVTYISSLFGFGAGRVGDQRPESGTPVRRGDTVQLVVLR